MSSPTATMLRGLASTTRDRHDDMRALVRGLPRGGLTWSPGDGAPTIAGLTLHVLDVEGYLAALAAGEPTGWTGERGTRIEEEATEAELMASIDEVDRRLAQGLAGLIDEPDRLVDETLTALVDDLDHVATHLGQMQLTRHLYEAAHPDAPRTYEHWR
jgi:hypothetical protein